MALLHLLHSVAPRVVAITVEHGLRTESLAEAKAVGAWCKKHKIEHHILRWRDAKPKTKVEELARDARYALLSDFCRERHILHLATAHHADDQAETILQRIAKASGPAGLSGISEHHFTDHLHIWRPLLAHTKSELVAYCEHFKIPVAHDPSNENPKYARGRLRGAVDVLAAEGLTTANLNLLARKQRDVQSALEQQSARFLARHTRWIPHERAEMSADAFTAAPAAVQHSVMDEILKSISGQWTPIRHESLANLCDALNRHGFRPKTLGHCRVAIKRIQKQSVIVITPEKPRA